jgi:hypothetical protein
MIQKKTKARELILLRAKNSQRSEQGNVASRATLANAQLLVDIKRKQKKKSRAEFRKASRFNAGRKAKKSICTMQSEKYPHRINLIQDLELSKRIP